MNIALWIVQILLAVVFLMVGSLKLLTPKEKAAERMGYVEDFSQGQLYVIGLLEVLGAIGLIVPMLLNIMPWLTPLAAIGLVLTMIGAAYTHFRRDEMPMIGMNVVLLMMAAFVAYGRFDLFG